MTSFSDSIVLVGMMGVGKTSVGRRLADLLRVPFHDSDDEVVKAASMTIPEIFETYGEPEFRRLERAVIARLLSGPSCVLSTGGGAFMQDDTRAAVKKSAISVWLDADLDVIWSRVADKPGRPLLERPNPRETLTQLAQTRSPIYALADLTVNSGRNDSQEEVAKAIIAAVTAYNADPHRKKDFTP